MSQVNLSGQSGVGDILAELGPSASPQLMFAALQLKLSEKAKTQAMDRMKQIEAAQAEQKTVADLLNQARKLQNDAVNGTGDCKWDKHASEMTPEMIKYMDDHNLPYDTTGNDHVHNKDEWNTVIQSLQSRMDELGSNTQQQMVYIQDFMGQYNSYLQGANTQISNANQTLLSLARGQ